MSWVECLVLVKGGDSATLRTFLRTQGLGIYEHPYTQAPGRVDMSAQNDEQQQLAAGFVSMNKTTQNLRRNYTSLVLAAL
jgi:hypothetical protein